MEKKQKIVFDVLRVGMLVSYVILCGLWLYAVYTRAGLETISVEMAEQISRETSMKNGCELCLYILFLIYSTLIWKWSNDKRYAKYILQMLGIIFVLFLLGCAFSGIQFLMAGVVWNNHFFPIIILLLFVISSVLLASGTQAKKEKDKI